MIRELLAAQRKKLGANRVLDRTRPVDERQQVWRNPERHRRGGNTGLEVFIKAVRHECADGVAKLADIGDRVPLLPSMIPELLSGCLAVGRQGPPVIALAQVT